MSIAESARRLLTLADTLTRSADDGFDDAALEHLVQGREGLVRWLGACGGSVSPEDAETVRRLVAMDAQLVTMLEEQRASLLGRLRRLEETRHSLVAYRGMPESSAHFVERVG